MPASKNTLSRYQILNASFLSRSKKYWTLADLQQRLQEHDLSVSSRTIEVDIEAMRYDSRLGYHAPIRYCTLNKGYYYTDSSYSISRVYLTDEELETLLMARAFIQPYGNVKALQDFHTVVSKVVSHVNGKVLTTPPLKVPEITCVHSVSEEIAELIDQFLISIKQEIVVKVMERKPASLNSRTKFFFHPYSIYFDQEHWYVIGLHDLDDMLIFRKFEQIEGVLFSVKPFKPLEVTRQKIVTEWEESSQIYRNRKPYQNKRIDPPMKASTKSLQRHRFRRV